MKTDDPILIDGYVASTSFVTKAIHLNNMYLASAEVAFVGGTPDGYLVVQVSNSHRSDHPDPLNGNWSDVTEPRDTTVHITGATVKFYNLSNLAGRWFRIKYTRTSGSSTVTIYGFVKGA